MRGIHKLRNPQPLGERRWNYVVIGVAVVFESGAWMAAWREFGETRGELPVVRALRQSKDPALFTAALRGYRGAPRPVRGVVGVFCADRLGWLWADGAAALVIGGILAGAGLVMAIETRGLLIGEAASPRLVDDIIGVAGRAGFVEAVNEVRTMHFGPADVLVNLSVDARDHLTAGEWRPGFPGSRRRSRRGTPR